MNTKIDFFELDHVLPNPWRPREVEDQEYLKELAEDIHANTMLQTPVGRRVDEGGRNIFGDDAEAGFYVQLAFGHHRLEAYRLLAEKHKKEEEWQSFPVNVRELGDEKMAVLAFVEGEKNKPPTAIERAKAVQRFMDDFDCTQAQAAKKLGLSRSAISNIVRLLGLPEELQEDVQSGAISERQAMAILPALELPAEVTDEVSWTSPKKIIKAAREGASSDVIRSQVDDLIRYGATNLKEAAFPTDEEVKGGGDAAPLQAAKCSECEKVIKRGSISYCPIKACYEAKAEGWAAERLRLASEATGITALEGTRDYQTSNSFSYIPVPDDEKKKIAERIIGKGCENLRLEYVGDRGKYIEDNDPGLLKEKGFVDVRIICVHKGSRNCKCIEEVEKEFEKQKKEDPAEKELEKKRKAAEKECKKILGEATETVAEGLASGHVGVWKILTRNYIGLDVNKKSDYTLDELRTRMAAGMLRRTTYINEPKTLKKAVTELLVEMGLEEEEMTLEESEEALLNMEPPEGDRPADETRGGESPRNGEDILQRLERIKGWLNGLVVTVPTVEAVRGNIANLEKLRDDFECEWGDEPDADKSQAWDKLAEMATAIVEWMECLKNIAEVLEAPTWSADDFHNVQQLTMLGVDESDFGRYLLGTPAPILNYTLALISGREGHGNRAGIIRKQLNVLEAAQGEPTDIV